MDWRRTSFSIRWFFRANGMKLYWRAVETMEGIRLIKQALPDVDNTGPFQCFFRLRRGARGGELVFCITARKQTDLAIVNTERLSRFASIPPTNVNWRKTCCFRIRRRMFRPMFQMRLAAERSSRLARADQRATAAVNQHLHRGDCRTFRTQREGKSPPEDLPLEERWPTTSSKARRDGLMQTGEKAGEGAAPLVS